MKITGNMDLNHPKVLHCAQNATLKHWVRKKKRPTFRERPFNENYGERGV